MYIVNCVVQYGLMLLCKGHQHTLYIQRILNIFMNKYVQHFCSVTASDSCSSLACSLILIVSFMFGCSHYSLINSFCLYNTMCGLGVVRQQVLLKKSHLLINDSNLCDPRLTINNGYLFYPVQPRLTINDMIVLFYLQVDNHCRLPPLFKIMHTDK